MRVLKIADWAQADSVFGSINLWDRLRQSQERRIDDKSGDIYYFRSLTRANIAPANKQVQLKPASGGRTCPRVFD